MKLSRKQLRKLILQEMMGPKSMSDYLKPHLRKHARDNIDRDTISNPFNQDGDMIGTSDYGGSYADYRDNIDSPMFRKHLEQFEDEESGLDPADAEDYFVSRAMDDLEDEGSITDMARHGSEGYQSHIFPDESDEDLGITDEKGDSQLFERRLLRKLILRELSKVTR